MDDSIQSLETEIKARLGCPAELGSLLRAPATRAVVADVLNGFLKDPYNAAIALNQIGNDSIFLKIAPEFMLSMHVHRGRTGPIRSAGTVAVSALDSFDDITLHRYRFAQDVDYAVFQRGLALVLGEDRRYDGAALIADPDGFEIVEWSAASPICELKVAYRGNSRQIWHFGRETLAAEFASLSDARANAHVLLCRMLGSLRERQSLPLLQTLSRDDCHLVRWAAIQAMGAIDRGAALTGLQAAVNDRHPDLRKSAAKVLSSLDRATA